MSWTPESIALAMFKADALALADAADVSSWDDETATGWDLTAAVGEEPTFRTNQINSLPAIEFGGAGVTERLKTSATEAFGADENHGVAVVARLDTQRNYNGLWSIDAASPAVYGEERAGQWGSSSGAFYLHNSSGNITAAALATGAFKLLSCCYGPSHWTQWENGAYAGGEQNAITINSGSYHLTVGNIGLGADSTWDGMIAELVVWRETQLCERTWIEGYLAHKYGLALHAAHPFAAAAPTEGPGAGGGGGVVVINRRTSRI